MFLISKMTMVLKTIGGFFESILLLTVYAVFGGLLDAKRNINNYTDFRMTVFDMDTDELTNISNALFDDFTEIFNNAYDTNGNILPHAKELLIEVYDACNIIRLALLERRKSYSVVHSIMCQIEDRINADAILRQKILVDYSECNLKTLFSHIQKRSII